jgi:hypothetical protein
MPCPDVPPVRTAESLLVDLADDPEDTRFEQSPITACDRLLGRSQDFGHSAERCPGIEVEGLDDSAIQYIDHGRFH